MRELFNQNEGTLSNFILQNEGSLFQFILKKLLQFFNYNSN